MPANLCFIAIAVLFRHSAYIYIIHQDVKGVRYAQIGVIC